ncbi:30S ribosomal protein S8 [Candidatus Vidania fulgoroideorum]
MSHLLLSNFICCFNNSYKIKKKVFKVKFSKYLIKIIKKLIFLKILKKFFVKKYIINVLINYNYKNVFLKIISKSSLRKFIKLKEIKNDLYFSLISTNKGILTCKEAIKKNIGGEHILYIYVQKSL